MGRGLLRQGRGSAFALIEAEKANYPITLKCEALEVSRAGFYESRARVRPTAREVAEGKLLDRIRSVHVGSRLTYGSPRVHAQLLREGQKVSRERVASMMRADGLAGRVRRRFKVTTDSKHARPVAPNRLGRCFQRS
jgi:putative transposase